MAIVQSFMTFMAMPIFGINQGIQPILGYNYGAKKYKRVKEALYKGIFAATIICFNWLYKCKIILRFFNSYFYK